MFFDGVVRTAFYLSMGTFWGELFVFETSVYWTFSDIERKVFSFQSKIFRQGLQNCFEKIQWNFLTEYFFLKKNYVIFFGNSVKTTRLFFELVRSGFENRNQRHHRNILRQIICFWKKCSFTVFGHWAKSFWLFVHKFPIGFSKLRWTDSLELFHYKFFPGEKFRYHFQILSKNCSAFLRTCSAGLSKPQSTWP